MDRKNRFYGWLALGVGLAFVASIYWSDIQDGQFLSKGNLLMLVILLGGGLHLYTWRNDDRAKKDERGRYIVHFSSKLGYRILTVSLFMLWLVDRKLLHPDNEFGNGTLFIALCLSLVLSPLLQLVVSRKYQ